MNALIEIARRQKVTLIALLAYTSDGARLLDRYPASTGVRPEKSARLQ